MTIDAADRLHQMPQQPEDQRVLRERARALREAEDGEEGRDAGTLPYVRFHLDGAGCYGVPYRFVSEVFAAADITPVPAVPTAIAGLVNWRGDLMTVIDLGRFFRAGDPVEGGGGEATIIVVRAAGLTVGLLADRIDGDDRFDPAGLGAAVPSAGIAKLEHVQGVHGGAVTILDVESLLRDMVDELRRHNGKTMPRQGEET